MFTENESNATRLWKSPNRSPHVKDAFHEYVCGTCSGYKDCDSCGPVGHLHGSRRARHHDLQSPGTPSASCARVEALGELRTAPLASRASIALPCTERSRSWPHSSSSLVTRSPPGRPWPRPRLRRLRQATNSYAPSEHLLGAMAHRGPARRMVPALSGGMPNTAPPCHQQCEIVHSNHQDAAHLSAAASSTRDADRTESQPLRATGN
jgi:hypothetical protein